MADRRPDSETATYQVVTRPRPDSKDWDDHGWIGVENRVVDALLPRSDRVHCLLSQETESLEPYKSQLSRPASGRQLFPAGGTEYVATVPDQRAVVRDLLAVDPGDTDSWIDRTFNVEEFAIVDDDGWCYWSVPHHSHIRYVDASGRDRVCELVGGVLGDIPGSALVPSDGLLTWETESYQYELTWDVLRRRPAGSESWTVFDLSRLAAAAPSSDGCALSLTWQPPQRDSWPGRLARRLLDSVSTEPPTRIDLPDGATRQAALSAFRRLKSDLGYDVAVSTAADSSADS